MNEISLAQATRILLAGWVRIAIAALVGGAILVGLAFASDPIYKSEVVLLPKESSPTSGLASQLGQFGGIAGLIGLNAGGSKVRDESLAVLRSRAFVSEFIKRNDLLPRLTLASKNLFRTHAGKNMDLQDAIKYFDSNVRTIYDDKKLGIIRITIRWRDPETAASLANGMAAQLNQEIREQAIQESTSNVEYLRSELQKSQLVFLSQAIGTLLEGEIKRLMIARGSEEYAFRILDPAQPAVRPEWPRPVFMGAIGCLIGGLLAILSLILPSMARSDMRSMPEKRST